MLLVLCTDGTPGRECETEPVATSDILRFRALHSTLTSVDKQLYKLWRRGLGLGAPN